LHRFICFGLHDQGSLSVHERWFETTWNALLFAVTIRTAFEPAFRQSQCLQLVRQNWKAILQLVPARNIAGGNGLGVTIDDVLLRQPVRAGPTNGPAGPQGSDEHLPKQLAWRLSLIGFGKHTDPCFSLTMCGALIPPLHGFQIARRHEHSEFPRLGIYPPGHLEGKVFGVGLTG
jgi:hypothetical protein